MGDGVSPEKMQVVTFTDSDHSIVYNNNNVFLYKFLTARLFDEVERKPEGALAHQWSKRGQVDA